ncbi:MAG: acyltransferase [Bacteroidales bacterium]|nr:acyltransferase [Bacteroidales bacterium]
MTTIIKATKQQEISEWHFSPLDSSLITMANSGTWLFHTKFDIAKLKSSLSEILSNYPVFTGRMTAPDCISTNNDGIAFDVVDLPELSCSDLSQKIYIPKKLMATIDIKSIKKGVAPIMSVKTTMLSDGTLISIAIDHVCPDGATLYRFISDWANIYNGIKATPVVINDGLFPLPIHTKDELIKLLHDSGWFQVGMKDLFSMLIDKIKNVSVIGKPIFMSYLELDEIRKRNDVSGNWNHALLCAILGDMIFDKSSQRGKVYSVTSVVNLRGRGIYPEGFVGNAVMNIASPDFDICANSFSQTEVLIKENIRSSVYDEKRLEEAYQLYAEAMTLKVPYIPFNLRGTRGKYPTCIIVNDFSGFPIYDINFGGDYPLRAYPNDLPDTIKIWPGNRDENGVYFLFRGNIAKTSSFQGSHGEKNHQ